MQTDEENLKGDGAQEVDQGPLIAIGPSGSASGDIEAVAVGSASGSRSSSAEGGAAASGESTVEKGNNADGEDIAAVPTASSAGAGALARGAGGKKLVPVFGINRPFFHIDIATALKSAVKNTGVVVADE